MRKLEITKADGKLNQTLRNEVKNAYLGQMEQDGFVKGANGKMFKAICVDSGTDKLVYVTHEVTISLLSPEEVATPKKRTKTKATETEVVDLSGLFSE